MLEMRKGYIRPNGDTMFDGKILIGDDGGILLFTDINGNKLVYRKLINILDKTVYIVDDNNHIIQMIKPSDKDEWFIHGKLRNDTPPREVFKDRPRVDDIMVFNEPDSEIPPETPGVLFIVTRETKEKYPDRDDLTRLFKPTLQHVFREGADCWVSKGIVY